MRIIQELRDAAHNVRDALEVPAEDILIEEEAASCIESLQKALQFYANPENYEYKRGDISVMSNVEWNEIGLDQGAIARSALQQKESE